MIPSRLVLPSMSICRVVERVRWDEVEVEVDDVGVVGIGAENREEPMTWLGIYAHRLRCTTWRYSVDFRRLRAG